MGKKGISGVTPTSLSRMRLTILCKYLLSPTFCFFSGGIKILFLFSYLNDPKTRFLFMNKFFIVSCLLFSVFFASGQKLDTLFSSPIPFAPAYVKFKTLANGKFLAGGSVNFYQQAAVSGLIRLNNDGTLDNTFSADLPSDFTTSRIDLQSNGNIVVSNNQFIHVLDADGKKITTITRPVEANHIYSTAIQSDDKILASMSLKDGTSKLIRYHASGTEDTDFDVSSDNTMTAVRFSNDFIFIAGNFEQVNGVAKNDIARLNLDGSVDESFDTGTGTDDWINAITVQPDGKVIPGKTFINSFNDENFNGIIRLNTDGSIDESFNADDLGLTGSISEVSLIDDKIIFTSYHNQQRLFCLHADGSINTDFPEIPITRITGPYIEPVSDGFIISNNSTAEIPFGIARYNNQGIMNDSFKPELTVYGTIGFIDSGSDGGIFIGGNFVKINDHFTYNLARLNADGTVNKAFQYSSGFEYITQLKAMPENRVLINAGGHFFMANADGSISSDFNFTSFDPFYSIGKFNVLADGRILITNGGNVGRLLANGNQDLTFNMGSGVDDVASSDYGLGVQSTGKIIFGSEFQVFNEEPVHRIIRLDKDGGIDDSFVVGDGPDNTINEVLVLPNDNIVASGYFNSFNGESISRGIVLLSADGTLQREFQDNLPSPMGIVHLMAVIKDQLLLADYDNSLYLVFDNGKENTAFSLKNKIDSFKRMDAIVAQGTHFFIAGDMMLPDQSRAFLIKLTMDPEIEDIALSSIAEDSSFVIDRSQLTVTDVLGLLSANFTVNALPGDHYTFQDGQINLEENYNGPLTLNIQAVNGNVQTSTYLKNTTVQAVNDKPVITGVRSGLTVESKMPLDFSMEDIILTDPDNIFPQDFTFSFVNGVGYSVDANQLTPSIEQGEINVTITVKDQADTSDPYSFKVNVTAIITGIETDDRTFISTYPNPTSGTLNVLAPGKVESLTLINETGQILTELKQSEYLDISSFQPGVYFLKINFNNQSVMRKVIKY
jgi:uncharacterized delta-60 repeat protein